MKLLAQRYAIDNWAQYAAANNITGWVADNSVPVCLWTGEGQHVPVGSSVWLPACLPAWLGSRRGRRGAQAARAGA